MWSRSIGAVKLWRYTNNIPTAFQFSQGAWPSAPLFFTFSPPPKLATHIVNSLPTNHPALVAESNISTHVQNFDLLPSHTKISPKQKQNPSIPTHPQISQSLNRPSFSSLATPCLLLSPHQHAGLRGGGQKNERTVRETHAILPPETVSITSSPPIQATAGTGESESLQECERLGIDTKGQDGFAVFTSRRGRQSGGTVDSSPMVFKDKSWRATQNHTGCSGGLPRIHEKVALACTYERARWHDSHSHQHASLGRLT